MNVDQYYKAPSDEIFNSIKKAAINLWGKYDDEFGYATGKIDRIKNIQNVSDNTCYMVAMFDPNNQGKLLKSVGGEAEEWLKDLLFNNQT